MCDFLMANVLQGKDVYNAYKVLETTDLQNLRGKSEADLQSAVRSYVKMHTGPPATRS